MVLPREVLVPQPGDLVVLLDPEEGAEIQVPEARTPVSRPTSLCSFC